MVADAPNFAGWSCPLPLRDHDRVTIGHGGGGQLSSELVEHLFLPAFGVTAGSELRDSALVDLGSVRLAFSTDSYVVRPLFFPGGCIGDLAVNGTVNDVAMSGAQPIALSAGFILEEGLEIAVLGRIATDMGKAAESAGVRVVTGDTKVVDAGLADGLYINTAGIGIIPEGVDIRPARAEVGDVVILSGPIGLHGIAVMSKRENLEFGTEIVSDTAPLHGLVAAMLAASAHVHAIPLAAEWRRRCARSQPRRVWASSSRRRGCRCRSRSRRPARSWASTRSASPTRASSSRSSLRMRSTT